VGTAACTHPAPPFRPEQSEPLREGLEARSRLILTNAILCKPEPEKEETLRFRLAPLLVREIGATAELPNAAPDASLEANTVTPELVYFQEEAVPISGRSHLQISFIWAQPSRSHPHERASFQGLRITLDSSGAPVLWQLLEAPLAQDQSNTSAAPARPRVFFVAESLEQSAAREHGDVLAGRRFALERERAHSPTVVVVRTLEDGPVPMGPMVYLQGRHGTISTVLCRCMPAQAQNILATRLYQLRPLDAAPVEARSLLEAEPSSIRVEEILRLPSQF
jgi:hypothetical protein